MTKRPLAWFLVAAGLWACGASDEAAPGGHASTPAAPAADEVAPNERDVAPVARYRFVDTSDGWRPPATMG
jgi:hypothetical protein